MGRLLIFFVAAFILDVFALIDLILIDRRRVRAFPKIVWGIIIVLVPFVGACIHVPPPPSNQIVYVKLKKPWRLESMQDPVWVTGALATQLWTNDAADADYVLTADGVEKFVVN